MTNTEDQAALRVDDIAFAFGGLQVLQSVSFFIERGSVTALVGQNGAGKSTLLNIVSGFRRPHRGHIYARNSPALDGEAAYRRIVRGMGRTFQEVRAFPRLTVLENVLVAVGSARGRGIADFLRRPRDPEAASALESLRWVGLDAKADQPASQLSFGQQRRLAFAQLLASGADLALLDEPTAGLDPRAVDEMETILLQLNRERGLTIVLVEHNLPFVRNVATSVIYLDNGRVAKHAPAEEVLNDAHFRRSYLGLA